MSNNATTETPLVGMDNLVPVYVNASDKYIHKGRVDVANGGGETVQTNATATGAVTINLANGNYWNGTLTGNVTLTLSGATSGVACSLTMEITQDATGGRTITWPASVKWPSGVAAAISTAANAVSMVELVTRDGGTTWRGGLVGAAYS